MLVKLDRCTVSLQWAVAHTSSLLCPLAKITSDHHPLLLDMDILKKSHKIFRFEEFWFKIDGFKDLVANWWREAPFADDAAKNFSLKLCFLKNNLKQWNKRMNGNILKRKIGRAHV